MHARTPMEHPNPAPHQDGWNTPPPCHAHVDTPSPSSPPQQQEEEQAEVERLERMKALSFLDTKYWEEIHQPGKVR